MANADSTILTRRKILVSAMAVCGSTITCPVQAQSTYPTQPLQVLVGFPAGSSTDIVTRLIATELAKRLGQPVVVENRPGAAGVIATSTLLRAEPNGYTLLMATTADTTSPNLNSAVTYDFAKDTAPIAMVAEIPFVLLVPASNPARSVKELISAASANSGDLLFGSSGTGTLNHLFGELFSLNTGTKLSHVPYRGSAAALVDLMSGRINMFFSTASAVLDQIKSGQLKALAIIGRLRLAALPDVPTFAEAGIVGIDTPLWFGLVAPAGTPNPILDRLNKETVEILTLPEIQAQLKAQGADPTPSTRAQFAAAIVNDLAKWALVAKAAKLTKN